MLSLSIVPEGGQTVRSAPAPSGHGLGVPNPSAQRSLYAPAEQENPAARRELVRGLLLAWYDENARDLPWRRTSDPYAILVSEIMLQQTQVDRVVPKYQQFLERFPTLEALAEASPGEVIRVWAPLGYNRRAVNLHRAAQQVVRRFDGRLPSNSKLLRSLPGIGTYTAAAVSCFAFGRPEAVVDTNVRRVLGRIERAEPNGDKIMRELATEYLDREHPGQWNQALMDLGSSICTSGSPRCILCPLRSVCHSSGRVIRETRARYRAETHERFEQSNRFLRGRIVDALRERDSLQIAEVANLIGAEEIRVRGLLSALEQDGLIHIDESTGLVRLP
jgi:A/G-specific adenine glycosylase